MTHSSDESDQSDIGISDDKLPEDLQPEENPLAEGLDAGESAGDLLEDGKQAEQSSDDETDQTGSDSGDDRDSTDEAGSDS
jgi:hypothetical protein